MPQQDDRRTDSGSRAHPTPQRPGVRRLQTVRRTSRLIRVRKLRCLLSIF